MQRLRRKRCSLLSLLKWVTSASEELEPEIADKTLAVAPTRAAAFAVAADGMLGLAECLQNPT